MTDIDYLIQLYYLRSVLLFPINENEIDRVCVLFLKSKRLMQYFTFILICYTYTYKLCRYIII